MKYVLFVCFMIHFSNLACCQIEKFNTEYLKLTDRIKTRISTDKDAEENVNNIGNELMNALLKIEASNEFSLEISPAARQLISSKYEPYILVLLERAIKENVELDGCLFLKHKLLNEISRQINLLMTNKYPYYNYNTEKKHLINFISIRTGNDMFTLAGLIDLFFFKDNKYWKDGGVFFQRNDDRDYTGSLLIEIGTDYMKTLRRRPLKTYQTLLYGFDVYTPYFRDSIVFSADTSFNKKDRPHASFQYLGWSKKGISLGNKYRWSTTLKFGKIGGQAGARFQNAIHQDISYSPRPKGWGAQIANGGRIGISVELNQEYFPYRFTKNLDTIDWRNLYLSVFSEEKIGTYMTTAGIGLRLSNKNFSQCNQNYINHRIRQPVRGYGENFMYSISFTSTYVQHNTMLEGYGIVSTSEEQADYLTPRSRYKLRSDQVRRLNFVLNTTVSYTTSFGSIFYNWKSISPETKLGPIGILSPYSNKEMDISHRWQHFAEIGITFNRH